MLTNSGPNPVSDAHAMMLRAEKIRKHFGGVIALDGVDLEVTRNEVHGLVGENGAGKSTFIKILGGIIRRDSGVLHFDGRTVDFHSPTEAKDRGIAIIHQELSVLPTLTVVENVFMGRMPSRLGFVSWRTLARQTEALLTRVGLDIDPFTKMAALSISQRQLVEIAKSLSFRASLIVMDEPNASLPLAESERLFELILQLKKEGITILYISHKLNEVLRITDRVSVFRDGGYAGTFVSRETTENALISRMVGRELVPVDTAQTKLGDVLLEVKNLTGPHFRNVSFSLRRGEVLGFSGLVGSGRSEVARTIFGADRYETGEIIYKGQSGGFSSPRQALGQGIAMLAEDRKKLSLFMDQSVGFNMSIATLITGRGLFLNYRALHAMKDEHIAKLGIKAHRKTELVSRLSGGNQQKTVLARWLATRPDLLILDEPTHGVDVGAKAEIYRTIRELSRAGMGVILISSEMPEIIALSDRVAVMHRGAIRAILSGCSINEEEIMSYAFGRVAEGQSH